MRYIGIDLGTTNSVISEHIDDGTLRGRTQVLSIEGEDIMPSIVSFDTQNNEILVGKQAKTRAVAFADETIISIKRGIGDRSWKREFFGKEYSSVDISAEILKKIKAEAGKSSNAEIDEVVITVPAYFDDIQRRRTKEAAQQAGLSVLQLISEPMAAALHYGWDRAIQEQTLLVYDLGGGTFDVCCLEIKDTTIKELGIKGDMHLGGDNFDKAIMDYLIEHLKAESGIDLYDDSEKSGIDAATRIKTLSALKQAAENAKKELSDISSTVINISALMKKDNIPVSLQVTLTREQFEDMIREYVDRTIKILQESLDEARKKPDDISRVILVGGSTNIPLVRKKVRDFLKEPYIQDPARCVSLGGALHAWNLSLPSPRWKSELITTMDLGIAIIEVDPRTNMIVSNNLFSVIIQKGSRLPVEEENVYQTIRPNQDAVNVRVFQGNNKYCTDNLFIGEGQLTGLPERSGAGYPVKVKFRMTEENILEVSAFDDSAPDGTGKLQMTLDTQVADAVSTGKKEPNPADFYEWSKTTE